MIDLWCWVAHITPNWIGLKPHVPQKKIIWGCIHFDDIMMEHILGTGTYASGCWCNMILLLSVNLICLGCKIHHIWQHFSLLVILVGRFRMFSYQWIEGKHNLQEHPWFLPPILGFQLYIHYKSQQFLEVSTEAHQLRRFCCWARACCWWI